MVMFWIINSGEGREGVMDTSISKDLSKTNRILFPQVLGKQNSSYIGQGVQRSLINGNRGIIITANRPIIKVILTDAN